jgi:hypothetical protein
MSKELCQLFTWHVDDPARENSPVAHAEPLLVTLEQDFPASQSVQLAALPVEKVPA